MKRFFFLTILLILVPSVFASSIFDDWVEDGQTFKAGDHYFYVQYIESIQKLNFKMDDMGGMLLVGECETRDDIKYCFEDVNLPQIKVVITSLEPDITIDRSFSTITPNLNENIEVTVTLKNNGDEAATNIKYIDSYPNGLTLFSNQNTFTWEGNINIGEEEKFAYTIRAEDIISFDSIAKLSYKFEGKEKTKKSSTASINVRKPFAINDSISTEAAEKGEIVVYNITILNKDESNKLSVENLEITLPAQIDLVVASNELKIEGNKLTFKGAIEKKETKTIFVRVTASRVGQFSISASTNLKISDKSFKEELKKSFTVGSSLILPILELPAQVKSNSPYSAYIALKNYGKEEIKNIKFKVEGDLFSAITDKKDIQPGTTYEVFKKTLTSPYLKEDHRFNIKISGSYISPSSGKSYTFEKSAQMIGTAPPNIIDIIRELNKHEFYPGDEIKITIKLKNQKNTIINEVDVSDIFPKEIRSSLKGDITGYIDALNPNEEKEIYSYSLTVPTDYTEDEIEFKTTLNAKVDGELIILKSTDKVKILSGEKPEEVEEETEEIEPEEEINQTGEKEIEQTKENFFSKIVSWLKNLFKRKQ